ncbi:unnamed protein product, partial [Oppiella nova]
MDTKQSLTFDSLTDEKIVLKNSDIWENSLSLGDGKLEVQSNNFQIRSTDPDIDDNTDDILFNVEPGEITLQAKDFVQPSLGGHNINTSLETNSIRGHLYHDLRYSLTFDSLTDEKIVLKNSDIWENSLSLGDGKLEVQSNNFQIRSTDPDIDDNTDDILFNVEPGEITLQAKDFLQPSLGGHNINTSLETNSIRGHLYHDL